MLDPQEVNQAKSTFDLVAAAAVEGLKGREIVDRVADLSGRRVTEGTVAVYLSRARRLGRSVPYLPNPMTGRPAHPTRKLPSAIPSIKTSLLAIHPETRRYLDRCASARGMGVDKLVAYLLDTIALDDMALAVLDDGGRKS